MTLNPSTIALLVLPPLVLWRVYARFRRSIGRQKFSKTRSNITLVLYPLMLLLLARAVLSHPDLAWMLPGGIAIGVVAAIVSLRMTNFELTGPDMYYTPNAHLGILVSLLFVGRILYRMIEMYTVRAGQPVSDFTRSPMTLLTFGLLAGYYIAYAIGLARQRSRMTETPATG